MLYDLAAYGLTERFAALASAYPSLCVGRILSQEKGSYHVVCAQGESAAAVSGKYRYQAQTVSDYPAVGDFVMLETGQGNGPAVIHALLARRSVFLRRAAGTSGGEQVVAANVDRVFLCMSLNSNFNLRRAERYLSLAWDSGAVLVLLLTKADLCGDVAEKRRAVSAVAPGVDVLAVSCAEQNGYAAVLPYVKAGQTLAFLGSSGVGKSTLINCLLGEERIKTGGLRKDGRGRHTTTHRELILLPQGGLLLDTPGMRELGMWDAAAGVEKAFGDLDTLARSCKFGNCTHSGEPGCAVQAALKSGTLSKERWQSYQKLRAENTYLENSRDFLAAKKTKYKEIAKQSKAIQKSRANDPHRQ